MKLQRHLYSKRFNAWIFIFEFSSPFESTDEFSFYTNLLISSTHSHKSLAQLLIFSNSSQLTFALQALSEKPVQQWTWSRWVEEEKASVVKRRKKISYFQFSKQSISDKLRNGLLSTCVNMFVLWWWSEKEEAIGRVKNRLRTTMLTEGWAGINDNK